MGPRVIQIDGRCHCGDLGYQLRITTPAPARRSCACDFCARHQPLWTSDPQGEVRLYGADQAIAYRFEHRTADFLVCARCGLLAAAVSVELPRRAVLNLRLAESVWWGDAAVDCISHEAETGSARVQRHQQRWTPLVD